MSAVNATSGSRTRITPREGAAACSTRKFYTIDEVAGLLGVSTRTIRRSIDCEELIAHKFGRAVRIAESDLNAFIAQHRCF